MSKPPVRKFDGAFDFGRLADDYDRWYATAEGKVYDVAQQAAVLRFLGPSVRGETLLDVGCGTGHWSRFFASLGFGVIGIDISRKMIEVARESECPGCAFQVADARAIPFRDKSFGVVACMATLEFISDPLRAVREMIRCRAEGGIMLIGSLNRASPINQTRLAKGREPYASGNLWTPGGIEVLLASFGRVRLTTSRDPLIESISGQAESVGGSGEGLDGSLIVAEVR